MGSTLKKISFISGTRADYGKIKPLISSVADSKIFHSEIIATGMHLLADYGMTVGEIRKDAICPVKEIHNFAQGVSHDIALANTIVGLSHWYEESVPDAIVVHGDRIEALAGAIVGAMKNIRVIHIEGGELSGTIDGVLRHAITKLSHLHFVANENARQRVLQLGEQKDSVFIIGSPDLDILASKDLPDLLEVKAHYELDFDNFGILIFHPVTTELNQLECQIASLIEALTQSKENIVIIDPNNDHGSEIIRQAYKKLAQHPRYRRFPSIRFEYFLTLLKNSKFIIGNSSAGVREAPFYGVPSINIGNRQRGRAKSSSIIHSGFDSAEILSFIREIRNVRFSQSTEFGDGQSSAKFLDVLSKPEIWKISIDKIFSDTD